MPQRKGQWSPALLLTPRRCYSPPPAGTARAASSHRWPRCRDLDEWPPIDLDSQLHSGLTHDVRHVAALQTKLALEDLHLLGECRRRRADWRHRALSEAFFISRRKETPLEAGDVEFRVYPVALLLVGLP